MAMRMTGLLAATAIVAALTAPIAAQAAIDLPLPPAVAGAITATATPAEIAALAAANPTLAATILAEAAKLGVTPESVVAAAIAADRNNDSWAIVEAATEAAPGSANAIVTAAAQARGLTLGEGGSGDKLLAQGIMVLAVIGLETAGKGDEASLKTVFAGLAAFLSPSEQGALARQIAKTSAIETDSADGYMASLQTGSTGNSNGTKPADPLKPSGTSTNGGAGSPS